MKTGFVAVPVFVFVTVGGILAGCGQSDSGEKGLAKPGPSQPLVNMTKAEMADKQGIPLYPGANVPDGSSSVASGATETNYVLNSTTPDPPQKVIDFYNSKVPGLSVAQSNGVTDLRGYTPKRTLAHIAISPGKDHKTEIMAAAIVEAPSK